MSDELKYTFKVGDKVKLKSGGPDMMVESLDTIDAIDGKEAYNCTWFTVQNVLKEKSFAIELLEKCAEKEPEAKKTL